MNELSLLNQATTLTMSSREIAILCSKEHKNVCRDIEKLNESYTQLSLLKIEQSNYVNERGQTYKEYHLTKEQTIDLVTGYSRELRIMINRKWLELENQNKLPTTYIEALQQLIHKEQEKQQLIETNTTLQEQKEQAKLRNGESILGASLKQVNTKLNSNYTWQPLRKYCSENELEPNVIYPNGYDCIPITVYPYEAWLNVYELDLNLIFN